MIRYSAFSLGHLDFFEPSEHFDNLEEAMIRNLQNPMMDIITVRDDKQIVTIAGITERRAGVGEVWLVLDKCYKQYQKSLVRGVKQLIQDYLVGERGFYRLEMAINANMEERQRWAEFLGFEKEGLMKAYDLSRVDHYLYARVF